MIELKKDNLHFSFPDVFEHAEVSINLQRTLRIPDDEKTYPLPPGLGRFPLRHVDDFADDVPPLWMKHGGVMLPMYQSEALWLHFDAGYCPERDATYPFAIKIAAGKINAVTGEAWTDPLDCESQDYVVSPHQPWLDGYCVEKGLIRQFVAMPLGDGYTAEEQITGEAEHGGIQVVVYPMKREVFERRFPKQPLRTQVGEMMEMCMPASPCAPAPAGGAPDMGLAAGGRMKQEIYDDPYDFDDWDQNAASRCFIHIANSLAWRSITGQEPPTTPPTAKRYNQAGLPWFDYYGDGEALGAMDKLKDLLSIKQMAQQSGKNPLPENASVDPKNVQKLRQNLKKGQVREGNF